MSRTASPCLRRCSAKKPVVCERCAEHDLRLALLQRIAGDVAASRLQARVGELREAEALR